MPWPTGEIFLQTEKNTITYGESINIDEGLPENKTVLGGSRENPSTILWSMNCELQDDDLHLIQTPEGELRVYFGRYELGQPFRDELEELSNILHEQLKRTDLE